MASKVLMGYMPELMENIFNNLNDEAYSLYSCALVSRHWCKMTIPILWQDPFSFYLRPTFIPIYFSSLNEDDKFILKENLKEYGKGIKFSKTLFEYAKFLKVLDLAYLENKVNKWINIEIFKLKLLYDGILIYQIINLLFKLFIESGATLHRLGLYFPKPLELELEIFYKLGQNEQFFSRIQELSLGEISSNNIKSATKLLRALAKSTTKISVLKLEDFDDCYELQIYHALIYVINSQEHLRLFELSGVNYISEFRGIISALDSQKNSLQEVILDNCDFSTEFLVLNNCKKIETLRLTCSNMKLMKFLNYKIGTLELIINTIDVQSLVLIFKKLGTLLQRLRFELEEYDEDDICEETLLLEPIKSFCPNITYLNMNEFGFSTQLLELIGNLKNLQFLTLTCHVYNIPKEEQKILVMQFSEILPLSLQYLCFGNTSLNPYLDNFLNYCNKPFKKLVINRLDNEKNAKALIEFCIRNRTFNYVSLCDYSELDDNGILQLIFNY